MASATASASALSTMLTPSALKPATIDDMSSIDLSSLSSASSSGSSTSATAVAAPTGTKNSSSSTLTNTVSSTKSASSASVTHNSTTTSTSSSSASSSTATIKAESDSSSVTIGPKQLKGLIKKRLDPNQDKITSHNKRVHFSETMQVFCYELPDANPNMPQIIALKSPAELASMMDFQQYMFEPPAEYQDFLTFEPPPDYRDLIANSLGVFHNDAVFDYIEDDDDDDGVDGVGHGSSDSSNSGESSTGKSSRKSSRPSPKWIIENTLDSLEEEQIIGMLKEDELLQAIGSQLGNDTRLGTPDSQTDAALAYEMFQHEHFGDQDNLSSADFPVHHFNSYLMGSAGSHTDEEEDGCCVDSSPSGSIQDLASDSSITSQDTIILINQAKNPPTLIPVTVSSKPNPMIGDSIYENLQRDTNSALLLSSTNKSVITTSDNNSSIGNNSSSNNDSATVNGTSNNSVNNGAKIMNPMNHNNNNSNNISHKTHPDPVQFSLSGVDGAQPLYENTAQLLLSVNGKPMLVPTHSTFLQAGSRLSTASSTSSATTTSSGVSEECKSSSDDSNNSTNAASTNNNKLKQNIHFFEQTIQQQQQQLKHNNNNNANVGMNNANNQNIKHLVNLRGLSDSGQIPLQHQAVRIANIGQMLPGKTVQLQQQQTQQHTQQQQQQQLHQALNIDPHRLSIASVASITNSSLSSASSTSPTAVVPSSSTSSPASSSPNTLSQISSLNSQSVPSSAAPASHSSSVSGPNQAQLGPHSGNYPPSSMAPHSPIPPTSGPGTFMSGPPEFFVSPNQPPPSYHQAVGQCPPFGARITQAGPGQIRAQLRPGQVVYRYPYAFIQQQSPNGLPTLRPVQYIVQTNPATGQQQLIYNPRFVIPTTAPGNGLSTGPQGPRLEQIPVRRIFVPQGTTVLTPRLMHIHTNPPRQPVSTQPLAASGPNAQTTPGSKSSGPVSANQPGLPTVAGPQQPQQQQQQQQPPPYQYYLQQQQLLLQQQHQQQTHILAGGQIGAGNAALHLHNHQQLSRPPSVSSQPVAEAHSNPDFPDASEIRRRDGYPQILLGKHGDSSHKDEGPDHDELEKFVQQEQQRTERIRKRYSFGDDDDPTFGFARRPSVRGIRPKFGTTNDIIQQMTGTLPKTQTLPVGAVAGLGQKVIQMLPNGQLINAYGTIPKNAQFIHLTPAQALSASANGGMISLVKQLGDLKLQENQVTNVQLRSQTLPRPPKTELSEQLSSGPTNPAQAGIGNGTLPRDALKAQIASQLERQIHRPQSQALFVNRVALPEERNDHSSSSSGLGDSVTNDSSPNAHQQSHSGQHHPPPPPYPGTASVAPGASKDSNSTQPKSLVNDKAQSNANGSNYHYQMNV